MPDYQNRQALASATASGVVVDERGCWAGTASGDVFTSTPQGVVASRFRLPSAVERMVADGFSEAILSPHHRCPENGAASIRIGARNRSHPSATFGGSLTIELACNQIRQRLRMPGSARSLLSMSRPRG
ncbi:hypothetical protein [Nocardia sp. X0981]